MKILTEIVLINSYDLVAKRGFETLIITSNLVTVQRMSYNSSPNGSQLTPCTISSVHKPMKCKRLDNVFTVIKFSSQGSSCTLWLCRSLCVHKSSSTANFALFPFPLRLDITVKLNIWCALSCYGWFV